MKRQKILVAGYYGYQNTGDEAILASTLAGVRLHVSDPVFTVLSGDPQRTNMLHGVDAVAWEELDRWIEEIRDASLVVVGGGGIFHDYAGAAFERIAREGPFSLESIAMVALVAKRLGKPLALHAVGVGPTFTPQGRAITKLVFDLSDAATVRDRASWVYLRRLGVKTGKVQVTADPAFLGVPASRSMSRDILRITAGGVLQGPVLGVSIREWPFGNMEGDWKGEITRAIDSFLKETGGRAVFLPFQRFKGGTTDDAAVSQDVLSRLANPEAAIVGQELTPEECLAVVNEFSVLLGMRYHSLVFAIQRGVPAVGIPYDPKVAHLLNEIGRGDDLCNPSHIDGAKLGRILALKVAQRREVDQGVSRFMQEAASRSALVSVGPMFFSSIEHSQLGPAVNGAFDKSAGRILAFLEDVSGRKAHPTPRDILRSPTHRPDSAESSPEEFDSILVSALEKWHGSKGVVVMPPTVDWGYMFQRPQQLARALAREGFVVVYCTQNSAVDRIKGLEEPEPRLLVSSLPLDRLRMIEGPILYCGRPSHRDLVQLLRPASIVYDHFDEVAVLHESGADHLRLLREADVVVASSESLYQAVIPVRSDALLVRNGVDLASIPSFRNRRRSRGHELTVAASDKHNRLVGYVGALAHWVDYPLIGHVAATVRDVEVILIGVDYDGSLQRSGILAAHNVSWVGMLSHAEAMRELSSLTIGIIPFEVTGITRSVSPVKLYEYLASGKPVVATDLPECRGYPGVLVAANRDEFVSSVEKALRMGDDHRLIAEMTRAAEENTWERRARVIGARLEELGAVTGVAISTEGLKITMSARAIEAATRLKLRNNLLQTERLTLAAELDEVRALALQFGGANLSLSRHAESVALEKSMLASQLGEITGTKGFRFLSAYWETRRRLRGLGRRIVSLLRRMVPQRFRAPLLALLRRRAPHPMRLDLAASPFSKTASERTGCETYDLVCFPIIDWHFRFQRPQQLVAKFAEDGHRCYYLATTFGRQKGKVVRQQIEDNIHEVGLPGPPGLSIYTDSLTAEACERMLEGLGNLRLADGLEDVVCLVQLPFWEPLASAAGKRWGWKVVYDCMDEHSGFSTNRRSISEDEVRLFEASDLVLASAQPLVRKASRHARKVLYLPNAADFDHFATSGGPSKSSGRPVIGYYGAISEWFDVEMVRLAAQQRPLWQFDLIGNTFGADVSSLRHLQNVNLLGEVPYSELPSHLQRFDVATIPFRMTPLTEATNPVKFYEYLSAGKPVVSVPLPELEPYKDLYYPAASPDQFVSQIDLALKEAGSDAVGARREFARANTWRARYTTLKHGIHDLFGRAAIVIVSRGNIEYTRLCLQSIWNATAYPAFEVVVVDNGSDRDVVAALHSMAEAEPRLKVIEAGENLGFAKANNIGISAAGECEYVVLLNNDTVVTRGWLSRLLHHLDTPDVSMVGPVTNWAGNEARIEVDYTSVANLERFAEVYAREHRGRTFEIPMLAMYCVALRRSLLDRIGMLDERFGIGLFEDDDFALRARRAGGKLICAEDVFVHHWGQATFSTMTIAEYEALFDRNRQKFESKWSVKWKPPQSRNHPMN